MNENYKRNRYLSTSYSQNSFLDNLDDDLNDNSGTMIQIDDPES